MRAAKAHLPPVHFFLDFSGVAFRKTRKRLSTRRDGVQSLLLVQHPVVLKLALQPLPRTRLDTVTIDQFRLIVRAQEEYRRAHRRRVKTTMPGTTRWRLDFNRKPERNLSASPTMMALLARWATYCHVEDAGELAWRP